MKLLRLVLIATIVLAWVVALWASGEGSALRTSRVLSAADCGALGKLTLHHNSVREALDKSRRRRKEVVSVSLSKPRGESAGHVIWARNKEFVEIVSSRYQPAGTVECDLLSRDVFIVLLEGSQSEYQGEMIRLNASTPQSFAQRRSLEGLEFFEEALGSFRYRPHFLAAGGGISMSSMPCQRPV